MVPHDSSTGSKTCSEHYNQAECEAAAQLASFNDVTDVRPCVWNADYKKTQNSTPGRCEVLATMLNGGLPALSQSINQPLLSPGPYTLDDAELAATCAVMSAEMRQLRTALRDAVRTEGAAQAAPRSVRRARANRGAGRRDDDDDDDARGGRLRG